MKPNYQVFVFVVLMLSLQDCTWKKADKSVKVVKPEDASSAMNSFHELMAESFHPFMDSSNLQPAKHHADELAHMAAAWADLAQHHSTNKVADIKLQQLKKDAAAFADLIKAGGSDEAIGKSLESLHELFHETTELWSSEPPDHNPN